MQNVKWKSRLARKPDELSTGQRRVLKTVLKVLKSKDQENIPKAVLIDKHGLRTSIVSTLKNRERHHFAVVRGKKGVLISIHAIVSLEEEDRETAYRTIVLYEHQDAEELLSAL